MRIFTSLMFDEETKNKLSELQATIKERGLKAKILPPSSLHVTLVFLGEVPGERLSDISVALSFSALSLSLPLVVRPKRFRFFGHSLVLELEEEKSLMAYQAQQVRAFRNQGFSFEDKRKFVPHVTLFRKAPSDSNLPSLALSELRIALEKSVVLESILGGPDPDYREVALP